MRARALSAFIQRFASSQPELLTSALITSLEEVEIIGDGNGRAKALATLVPFLPLPISDDSIRRILTAGDVPESVARFELWRPLLDGYLQLNGAACLTWIRSLQKRRP